MSSAQCSEHKKLLDIFCEQCDLMICSLCLVKSHSGHGIVDVEKIFNERKGKLTELFESTQSLKAQITEKTDEIRSSRQSVRESSKAIVANIDETFRRCYDDLEKQKQILRQHVTDETEQRMKVFDDHVTILESANTEINNLQIEIKTTLSKDTTSLVQLCGSMEKSHEKVVKKAKEIIATSFVPPKDLKRDISAPWMEEAIRNIKLVEPGQGKQKKNAFTRSVSMILQENDTLQRNVQDLLLEVEQCTLRIKDTERRKEEKSYQLEDERRKNEELIDNLERDQELRKVEWKKQFDELERTIIQTSQDQVDNVRKHFRDKEKSLSRFLDLNRQPMKLSPVCSRSFLDVADDDIVNTLTDICPICRMTKGENMSNDDFMRHVNKHFDEENE